MPHASAERKILDTLLRKAERELTARNELGAEPWIGCSSQPTREMTFDPIQRIEGA